MDSRRTHSFLIRVWLEPREIPGAEPEWRVRIEHVQTGRYAFFRNLDDVVMFIRSFTQFSQS